MSSEDVLSLSAIDYVEVDKERLLVTVGAGAKVSTVLSELKKHGLTLQNFSSIQEQQIGGWTQVAAHGTGVSLPTGKVIYIYVYTYI
jgi:L-galactono-1,4-lactone dehydrogenase